MNSNDQNLALPQTDMLSALNRRAVKQDSEYRLIQEKILNCIDINKFQQFYNTQASSLNERGLDSRSRYKYLRMDKYLSKFIEEAIRLGLNTYPLRILDLGAGAGYFTLVCKALGHEAIALNPPNPLYPKIYDILGLESIVASVEPFQSLGLNDRFDLIAAFAAKFHSTGRNWTHDEWDFFLSDIFLKNLNPEGRLLLDFNTLDIDGNTLPYYVDLFDYLSRRGAVVDHALGRALLKNGSDL